MMTAQAVQQRQIRLLLVDDHRVFAEVLASHFRAEPKIDAVEVAFSLAGARAMVNTFRPDLILLDYQLADELGLELLPDLNRMESPPDVLMLSGTSETRLIVTALDAGVQGWVNKEARFETLVLAATEVLSGHMYLPPPTLKPVIRYLLAGAKVHEKEPSFLDGLSPRESEVLSCLVAGMSRAEVADRLYVSVNTVRTHVQNLLRAADQHSTLSLVALARDLGVRSIDSADAGPENGLRSSLQ
jgi:DNA-binding NarL/FixJ family response regulator